MGQAVSMMAAGTSAEQAKAINGTVATGLTAAGSATGDAYVLTSGINNFTTVASSTGARLPDSGTPGDCVVVANNGANTLTVYSPTGGTVNGGSSESRAATTVGIFYCISPLVWVGALGA